MFNYIYCIFTTALLRMHPYAQSDTINHGIIKKMGDAVILCNKKAIIF